MIILRNFLLSLLVLFTATGASAAQEKEIVFAISPMASPVSTLLIYGDFIKYLSEKTGIKIVLKQRRKYSEINDLLKTGRAQFAYTCTGAYLDGRKEFGLEVLAVPVIDGKTTYNSYIIVNKESDIVDFRRLQGKVFAFTDPLSLTGRLYPVYLLNTMNARPGDFFRKTFYTSSHEKSIESVAYGFADGAAVDSLIYDNMKRAGSSVADLVKIIRISPPYGIPPIVASPVAQKSDKRLILSALIKMAADPEGRDILMQLQIERFIIPSPAVYHNAVKLTNIKLPQ
ncbi:MAG TPA: phosphate/phosphite/phosphonate ABC transporter substrate-binding protein [Nitrospirae bacterium]|nr:phosphate/phosphite/phosphonate ABC transporter substrate-binding protein [Nitrospirota bacterium]